jgi:hypothetical protein
MIDMPLPPEPPELPAEKVRDLVEYADRMAAFIAAETELVGEFGRTAGQNDLTRLVEGWKFTARALRDSYDG